MVNFKNAYSVIITLLLLVILLYCFNKKSDTIVDKVEIIRIDTLFDTVRVNKPIVKKIEVVRLDTLYLKDTTFIVLPIERKIYKDSNYTAIISGYKPILESIEVYNKTIEKEVVKTIIKKPFFTYGIQAGAGYDLLHQQPAVYVGVGVQLNF